MEAKFWHQLWQTNELGFHLAEANPQLIRHIEQLHLTEGDRVFVPLCGKTKDIAWLLCQGYKVVGCELSELAVEQLFDELGLKAEVKGYGRICHYSSSGLDIWQGDIFDLEAAQLGCIDAVYDRAALVALPQRIRERYSAHLITLTKRAQQLLVCYNYPQQQMDGPPFSINGEEIERLYGHSYDCEQLGSYPEKEKLKGQVEALEEVWLLR